jgi:modification methylase
LEVGRRRPPFQTQRPHKKLGGGLKVSEKTATGFGGQGRVKGMEIKDLSITEIRVGYHPRKVFRGKEELKEQIQRNGLNEPLRVRPENDCFVVIDGNRRFSVLKELGYETVPCFIEEIDERSAAHQSYTLNTGDYRRNLNPIEVSLHIKEMRERFGYSVQDLLGLGYATDDQTIYNKLALLSLPEEIQNQIADGAMNPTEGYRLASMKDAGLQKKAAEIVLASKDRSVRKTEKIIKTLIDSENRPEPENVATGPLYEGDIPGVFFNNSKDMPEIPDGSVALVVTSPPYWLEREYESGVTFDEHLENISAVLLETAKKMVPGGRLCINFTEIHTFSTRDGGSPEIKLMGSFFQEVLRPLGIKLVDEIIWRKGLNWVNNPQCTYHEKSKHSEWRVLRNTEKIFVFRKDGQRVIPLRLELESKISKEEWKQWVDGVWEVPPVRKQDSHPAEFPEEIPRRLVKMFSFEGDIVLDPFGGTMTTVKVARELGRRGIGYEKDLKYKSAIMKKLGIKVEDLKKSDETGPEPQLSKEERTEAIKALRTEILPSIVEEHKSKGERISRLSFTLKPNLSKKDISVDSVPVDDDFPPTSPNATPQVSKADDYADKDALVSIPPLALAKAA